MGEGEGWSPQGEPQRTPLPPPAFWLLNLDSVAVASGVKKGVETRTASCRGKQDLCGVCVEGDGLSLVPSSARPGPHHPGCRQQLLQLRLPHLQGGTMVPILPSCVPDLSPQ